MTTAAAASRTRRWLQALLVLPALAFSAVVFLPIARNYFFSDDFLNLYHIADHSLLEYLLTPNGGHILVARNAVFYLAAQFAGTYPAPYYWSALATHLLNVLLLFHLVRVLTRRAGLACFAATLWGISPFHEGTLGWYSVYGHAMVATALLIILSQACRDAATGQPPTGAQRRLWYVLALIAATSFGTGTAIAIVLPLVLHLFLAPAPDGARRWPLWSLAIVIPLLYVTLLWAYRSLVGSSPIAQSPLALLFSPLEIVRYMGHLTALGFTRLLIGAYPADWATLAVWYAALAALAVALLAACVWGSPTLRRQLLACTVLLLACYGSVAMARTLFLVKTPLSVLPTLTRYHYVGQLILTLMLCLLLNRLAAPLPAALRLLALLAWFGTAVAGYARFAVPIDHHDKARQDTSKVLTAFRLAIDKQPLRPSVYIPNRRFAALPLPVSMFPGWAGVFVIFHPDNQVDGRRVYFIDPNPVTLEAAQRGRRTRRLIVPQRPPPAP